MVSAVEVRNISMAFGSNQVLTGVDLTIDKGQTTALLGANGAGKSTLIKILSGVYSSFTGEILIDGKAVTIDSPTTAKAAGIETVHQRIDEGVIPGLTVAENLLFERIVSGEISRTVSLKTIVNEAEKIASALDLKWSKSKLRNDVYELGIAEQQMLILARALSRSPKLLILDEPTSALSNAESQNLFKFIKNLESQGIAILYVSHKLSEIEQLAKNLVVIRDGKIRNEQSSPFSWDLALKEMLGQQELGQRNNFDYIQGNEVALKLEGVKLFKESSAFDLEINRKQVTGIIGLLGAGKTELAKVIYGADNLISGNMKFDGKNYKPTHPSDAVSSDIYLVPEDRAADSMIPNWSIAHTATLPFMGEFSVKGMIKKVSESIRGKQLVDDLKVVTTSHEAIVDSLSGGNQQKVVVGRWLQSKPKMMILDEPFRGVDIGARRDISKRVRDLAATDVAVLVLASDVDEILDVADRIIVLVEGKVVMDVNAGETSKEKIVNKMSEVA
ncbi:MAG: sugar ABC transporter ATP-binding protein [Actinomycetota bacterium]|nr:sugar ABC transporter ATP-binding protein [Actinomycetota bacterium]MDA3026946.1 sugar ABC transporter ATP-binding protein [Actinomycetota bacterium]